VVGPAFDLVSKWAADGVPLKVAYRGIDRYVGRYYRQGPRRRPVRIEFCEADVRDVFDEWRRAIGLPANGAQATHSSGPGAGRGAARTRSLRAHLERALLRLTSARATLVLPAESAALLDRISQALDAALAAAGRLRGEARRAVVQQLEELDAQLVAAARISLGEAECQALVGEANEELAAFRDRMSADAYGRARDAAVDRLARERLGLPHLTL
jgi:hypothetical protein